MKEKSGNKIYTRHYKTKLYNQRQKKWKTNTFKMYHASD